MPQSRLICTTTRTSTRSSCWSKFTEFNDSSLDLFVYCFTASTDWTKHLSVRQDVNLKIMELVEDRGMSIAFPTRTVHLVEENAEAAVS